MARFCAGENVIACNIIVRQDEPGAFKTGENKSK